VKLSYVPALVNHVCVNALLEETDEMPMFWPWPLFMKVSMYQPLV